MKRAIALLLALMLTLSLLPGTAGAQSTDAFVLVAEAGGKLVISPEYVTAGQGQTIAQALAASGHTFTGLDSGIVTAIDGVSGNYTRSDEKGGYDLTVPASSIGFFRFSENSESSQPGQGLQALMTAMADYRRKAPDVQAAAREAYADAQKQFVGVADDSAALLAKRLNQAVADYEAILAGQTYSLTFRDGTKVCSEENFPGIVLTAENAYGKLWTDDGDGVLSLPKGEYTFTVSHDGNRAKGQVTLPGTETVTLSTPEKELMQTDGFRLSGSYGADTNTDTRFTDAEFTLSAWQGRSVETWVEDTFAGALYAYVPYDTSASSLPVLTAEYQTATTGETMVKKLNLKSLTSGAYDVLAAGTRGTQVIYRMSVEGNDGYTYSQEYTVTLHRTPTLSGITVTDQDGTGQAASEAFDSGVNTYTYKVLNTVTQVTIQAEPSFPDSQVTVNGQDARQGVTVPVSGDTAVEILVSTDGGTNRYTLNIQPGKGRNMFFLTDKTVTMEVVNRNGVVMPYVAYQESPTQKRYKYTLVPGEEYSYVATRQEYYHIADSFRLEELTDSTITVNFAAMEDWLTALDFGNKNAAAYQGSLPMKETFDPARHSYTLECADTLGSLYAWAATQQTGVTIQAVYNQIFSSKLYHGVEKQVTLTSGAKTGQILPRVMMSRNPIENTVTVRLSKEAEGVSYYQDYVVRVARTLSLAELSADCDGSVLDLMPPSGDAGFAADQKDYYVTVPIAARQVSLTAMCYSGGTCYGETEVGYRVFADNSELALNDYQGTVQIPLDGTANAQTVTISVRNDKAPDGTTDYTVQIRKVPPLTVYLQTSPEEALLQIRESQSGSLLQPGADGGYQLSESYRYAYALTLYGYVAQTGVLEPVRDSSGNLALKDGSMVYPAQISDSKTEVHLSWTLTPAPVNGSIPTGMSSEWPDFRGNLNNNAVIDAPTPTQADNGTLYWAKQLGEGYGSQAVSNPILVDGDLVVYAANMIYRVDSVTGEVKKQANMDHSSSFAINPPTYAEGMIFVGLANGTVQAFNADTLESLWIYKDPLGGQPNCPISVRNGYLYTGFWNSESGKANFVCLSITDEDPSQPNEAKCASWYYTQAGGFYWAGPCVRDDFVLVGTDDGNGGYSGNTGRLLLLDVRTGELLDSLDNLAGDVRSSVVYDSETNAYYFTSKGGTFYSVQVSGGKLTNVWSVALQNGTGGTAMSTCSPAVHGGRAYIGVSGSSQFGAYSGHNITVIDLNNRSIAYRVNTQGYPQTSGLLTTAYEADSGCVYVYFFDNYTPGILRVLRDHAGQTAPDYVTDEKGNEVAYALFTPVGAQAQYALCSPIADAYGNIYFKNDSANLMCFGSTVERLEITEQPTKTKYAEGETFDPEGMQVAAVYANGQVRDVTEYVTYNTEGLTGTDAEFTVSYPYAMYQNQESGSEMQAGVETQVPTVTIQLEIGGSLGDVNGDGKIDKTDAQLILNQEAGLLEKPLDTAVADVNGDGVVDSSDAVLVARYAAGTITGFPKQNTDNTEPQETTNEEK